MCTLNQDDPVEAYRESAHTARKAHSCSGCGATIQKGEAYCRLFYVADHSASSEKECFACWWTRHEFWEAHSGGPLPWALEEYLHECIEGDRSSPWRPHLAALKRRWRVSDTARRDLRTGWFICAVNRQLELTRRILRKRAA